MRRPGASAGATSPLAESKDDSPHIDSEKVRDGAPLRFAAAAHFGDDTFYLRRTGQEKPRHRLSPSEKHVVDYIAEHAQATTADIDASVDPDLLSSRTARNALMRLIERKLVRRCNEGGHGAPALYELASRPVELPDEE